MHKGWKWLLASGLLAILAGCGGASSNTASSAALTGLAATGAGIANGTVTAKCVNGPDISGTTDGNGIFTLPLGSSTAPCMVRVSGGTPAVTLYSYAATSGRVNITPVSDLVVARALGVDPASQFTSFGSTASSTIASNLSTAKTYVNAQLAAVVGAGLSLDPLNGSFAVGDADDKLLDALGLAMVSASQSIEQLRTSAKDGGELTVNLPPYLAAPAGASATANSSSQITLNWSAVAGATGYHIYRAGAASVAVSEGNKITVNPVTAAGSYADSGLSASSTYYYKVVATNAVTSSAASAEVSATTSAASTGAGGSNSGGGTAVESTSYGSLAVTGNAVGIAGATVPASFVPTAYGTHPTTPVSWSVPVSNTPWYITLNSTSVTSTGGFGSWQKTEALNGTESLGVAFDMPNGQIRFTNVTLPAFAVGQTGSMILNGTLNVPAATGTALTITGTGTNAAGTGLDASAATATNATIGSTTITTYTWNGGKGVSVVLENYSSGTKSVTVTNAAGPSWRNLSAGTTVTIDTGAKAVTFTSLALTGISPTTSSLTLNGTLTIP